VRINKLASKLGSQRQLDSPGIYTASEARAIAANWIQTHLPNESLLFGLPEVDDRHSAWRISILSSDSQNSVGELMVSCKNGSVTLASDPLLIQRRLHKLNGHIVLKKDFRKESSEPYQLSGLDILLGDSREILQRLPNGSAGLVITSPPYFNAKLAYSEYTDYEEYLDLLKDVFIECHRVLSEGRFLIVNASPVLVRRSQRNQASRRIPVPFHINTILERNGFDFLDDIVWVKPSGAGWNTGRGRRFAADRNPLQYKPVPITEYFLVYRKHTNKLIDWNIRSHPDQEIVKRSKIPDGYEITNVWKEHPANHPIHPAVFPEEIIRKFIRYYSFENDIVLDPFAGIGTVGHAALLERRKFCLIDSNLTYYNLMRRKLLG